ncbi:FKBP-type peptidyl-prolyl cis-trans isomerase [Actinomyces timonensis]|uniref:Peptidyl-prolyl cis-trans isomerase n=1 Tax=Actinomyces timonensis TaxID=1288391 RepID=A0AAU8N1V7_9ACTO
MKPLTGVDCSTLTIDSDSAALPAVSGDPGAQPTLAWSGQAAPANLTVKTLNEGTGDTVSDADVVTASYVGWEWGSDTTFDSSYKRGAPTPFSLKQVVPGWTCGLAGHRVGERVLMSIPPELGYGQGVAKPGSGRPEGPLVFVVEIVSKASSQDVDSAVSTATAEGEDEAAARGITVTGALGSEAAISVASGAAEPTQPEVIVLARGTGRPLAAGSTVAANLAFSTWDGSRTGSTWKEGVLQTVKTAELKGLEGVPTGSRVIVLTPPAPDGSAPSFAYVMDLGEAL